MLAGDCLGEKQGVFKLPSRLTFPHRPGNHRVCRFYATTNASGYASEVPHAWIGALFFDSLGMTPVGITH